MSRRAVILAGGQGTRLTPLTAGLPKPLLPVGQQSVLELIITRLAKFGFTQVTLAVNHEMETFRSAVGDGSRWNIDIDYSVENMPLGTIGPIKIIADPPEHFLVMNGDVLTDLDLGLFYSRHVSGGRLVTVAACRRDYQDAFGVLRVTGNTLTGFREKPVTHRLVSMGINMISRKILGLIPDHEAFGFDDLMHTLIARGDNPVVHEHTGIWFDIGRVEDYEEVIRIFA